MTVIKKYLKPETITIWMVKIIIPLYIFTQVIIAFLSFSSSSSSCVDFLIFLLLSEIIFLLFCFNNNGRGHDYDDNKRWRLTLCIYTWNRHSTNTRLLLPTGWLTLYSWSFFGLRLYSTVDSLQWHIGESKCRTWLSLFTVRRFTAISGHVFRIVVSRSLSISCVDSWSTFLSFYMSSQNANSLIVINYLLHKVVFQHFILFCLLIFVLMFPPLVVEQFKQSLTASSVVTHYHSIVHWLDHFVGLVWSVGWFWSI